MKAKSQSHGYTLLALKVKNSRLPTLTTLEIPRIWNLNGQVVHSFKGHTGAIKCMDVLPNEAAFVSGSKDTTIKFWSLEHPSLNVR
jgi:WD40 repeat protein